MSFRPVEQFTIEMRWRIVLCVMMLEVLMPLNPLFAQPFQPGQTYFGVNGYIEYQPGNLPFILSVPHGGHLEPANIPDRNCVGCAYVKDAYTQELARAIREALYLQTGCYPYVVYNLLHRKKLDMNRDILAATDTNPLLNGYWNEYHDFLDSAAMRINQYFGKGLFIDLHGHGHAIQRIELGYLLYDTQLQEPDSILNTPPRISVSSIESLAGNNASNATHAELLRGDEALGTQFANHGYPGVPSLQDPFPQPGDPYFNGGYNTYHHGSSPGGTIDAVQLELYSAIRFDSLQRMAFADSFAVVVLRFLSQHYFPSGIPSFCSPLNTASGELGFLQVRSYPNPASESIYLQLSVQQAHVMMKLEWMDLSGRVFRTDYRPAIDQQLSVADLSAGVYLLRIQRAASRDFMTRIQILR